VIAVIAYVLVVIIAAILVLAVIINAGEHRR